MDRRSLLFAGTLVAGAVAAGSGHAAAPTSEGPPADASLNMMGVGLPVIVNGRIRNYVFVTLKLILGAGQNPQSLRPKEPHIRDALVRAAHRAPFTVEGDWTTLNVAMMSAAVVAAADVVAGQGSVTRVEVVSQAARRRTGVPTG